MSERRRDRGEAQAGGEGAAAAGRERAAHTAHASRAANERIRAWGGSASFFQVTCECVDPACRQPIPVTREEYEDVRSSARQFLVANGHIDSESEVVVEAYARYVVVRKIGAAAAVAEALDARGRRSLSADLLAGRRGGADDRSGRASAASSPTSPAGESDALPR